MIIKKIVCASRIMSALSVLSLCIDSHQIRAYNQAAVVMRGSGVDNQVVTGTARIVTRQGQLSKVCKGDIVVACMTEASWESVLCLAAGIITDQGDSQCHAALFGKRMGIPVLVGTHNATTIIVDGQQVTIDSSKNSFSVSHESTVFYTHKSGGYCALPINSAVSSYSSDSAAYSFDGKIDKRNCQRVSRFNITREKIQHDLPEIVRYISQVAYDIGRGELWGKKMACYFGEIDGDVFDSMPVLFFRDLSDSSKIDKGLQQTDMSHEAIEYIQEGMKVFVNQNEKPVHLNVVGRLSYRRMVDKLGISEEHKQILKKTPIKMNEFIKNNIVKKAEYMYFNMLNLTTQYYLKKHGIIV